MPAADGGEKRVREKGERERRKRRYAVHSSVKKVLLFIRPFICAARALSRGRRATQ
jgi:hypothetical protein